MEFYNPFESMTFTYDRCFLCGKELTDIDNTQEHVYPRWLQREFNLWNEQLTLLNGTNIKYKQLKIPCCKICNNDHLNKKVEKKIEEAVKGGYEVFKKLDEKIIFQWLNKMAYGMLFKELSLKSSLKDFDSSSIYSKKQLEQHKMQFVFLQSVRFNTEFTGKPWSILIFKIKTQEAISYNSMDFIQQKVFIMQLNDIGIVACLMDNGYQEQFFKEKMPSFLNIEIHPIQFAEICARFLYKSTLFYRDPFYIIMLPKDEQDKMAIISQPIEGNAFEDWSYFQYARYLEMFFQPWRIPFSEIYFDDDHIITFLYNKDGSIKNND